MPEYLIFAQPWGWYALLGLVWVIIVHSLQQVTRRERVSTLFLLERLQLESKEGQRLRFLRQSVPFWLQVLSVLILTWLLLDPRWQSRDNVQQVTVVFDSTLSMDAFRDDWPTTVEATLERLSGLAPTTYWTVMCTDPNQPVIYRGTNFGEWWSKMADWQPTLATHDPTKVLQLARSLASTKATVIFVTDRNREVPAGVELLAVGHPVDNCAIMGMRLEPPDSDAADQSMGWKVLILNDGKEMANRTWWVEAGAKGEMKSPAVPIEIPPHQTLILKGTFPKGADRLTVCLSGDTFSLDDRLPIILPVPKQLAVNIDVDPQTDPKASDLFSYKLLEVLPGLGLTTSSAAPDLLLSCINPRRPLPTTAFGSIVLLNDPLAKNDTTIIQPFVSADDDMIRELSWKELLYSPCLTIPPLPDDLVLLWKGQDPLIFQRTSPNGHRQLVFNLNFPHSNLENMHSFVILVRRFIENIRRDKIGMEARNFQVNESFHVAVPKPNDPVVMTMPDGKQVTLSPRTEFQAPQRPGFFSLSQNGQLLVDGAAQLDDAQLSDFSSASSTDTWGSRKTQILEMHSEREPWAPLWLLLLGAVLLINWRWTDPKGSAKGAPEPPTL